ncbi:MAG TPA: acyl-ACP--UDP-N-acetylglucosamine O-acyltransferase [Acidobacteriota bacterium]|nr:acyl-ACP--UDP-N-acetylglucosamine O-acyltransferase [Acidobacteriota bacterium]
MAALIHPTAVVSKSSRLEGGVEVGPFAVIEDDVEIGDRCRIGAHAVIKKWTRMGEQNEIFEHAVIGGAPQDLKYSGEVSGVRIGRGNTLREGVTVHRSADAGGETMIGDGNYLMAYAHIAHDCVLEDSVVMANNVALAGHVRIQTSAFISGGVVIHQYCRVGRHAMIGGNAKITLDVLPYCLADGPSRTRGLNRVGLQRSGFSQKEIAELKRAYRALFFGGGRLKERLETLSRFESPHVRSLLQFIQESQRGFCRAEK